MKHGKMPLHGKLLHKFFPLYSSFYPPSIVFQLTIIIFIAFLMIKEEQWKKQEEAKRKFLEGIYNQLLNSKTKIKVNNNHLLVLMQALIQVLIMIRMKNLNRQIIENNRLKIYVMPLANLELK